MYDSLYEYEDFEDPEELFDEEEDPFFGALAGLASQLPWRKIARGGARTFFLPLHLP